MLLELKGSLQLIGESNQSGCSANNSSLTPSYNMQEQNFLYELKEDVLCVVLKIDDAKI